MCSDTQLYPPSKEMRGILRVQGHIIARQTHTRRVQACPECKAFWVLDNCFHVSSRAGFRVLLCVMLLLFNDSLLQALEKISAYMKSGRYLKTPIFLKNAKWGDKK